ncbi:hypothetical protein PSHT_02834 [Puccinia striiformis]|uniref:pectin lyase n=2 Tax=Puccinia striiformis TaxID=27350 RepID=A0A2S4VJ54_9BASI|nr:hypothetical protein PSTT_06715 [Puccinia striiformis]POW21088.1 hypothetical protein PSHT_02834 [Puccinia striiformis]
MAGSLPFILLCLQLVSIVFSISDLSGHVYRRSPAKTPKPAPGTAAPNGTPPNPRTTGKPRPFGFGSKVTGGGNATPQTPKDAAQLEAWLTDKVPRVILISKTYDFTSLTNTTANGCRPWKACSNGLHVQSAVNYDNWCSKEKTLGNVPVSLIESPLNPIKIASRKTLLGVGKSAVIKGKGFSLYRTDNIIIQNIHITSLNPHIVWGGDAIMLNGATNIWIDHCSFSNIGRQMIVSGGESKVESNKGITISNNLFSGKTQWSARCQNRHYWTTLFSGPGDEITMARKLSIDFLPLFPQPSQRYRISMGAITYPENSISCIDSTSGRSPKTGGSGNPKVLLHYYNNIHTNVIGETFEIGKGSNVVAEGNVFENVKIQDPGDLNTQDGGYSYVPLKEPEAVRCQSILGRHCVTNLLIQSSPYKFSLDTQALDASKAYPAVTQAKVMPASSIQRGVPGRCGVGNI